MNLFNRNDKPEAPSQTAQPKPAQPPAEQKAAAPKVESEPPKPAEPKAAATVVPSPPPTSKGAPMGSVISKALKITGELESTEDIQIDGQIDGDVRGVGVKIGQNAKVKGTVYGDEVELAGTIEGRIESKKVTLGATARMTGDIWFQDIKIDSGAYISGNLKPGLGKQDAKADIKSVAKPSATVSPLSPGLSNGTAHA